MKVSTMLTASGTWFKLTSSAHTLVGLTVLAEAVMLCTVVDQPYILQFVST